MDGTARTDHDEVQQAVIRSQRQTQVQHPRHELAHVADQRDRRLRLERLAIYREAIGHHADGRGQLERLHEVGGLADALLPVSWGGGHETRVEAGAAADGEDAPPLRRIHESERDLAEVEGPRPRPHQGAGCRGGRERQAQHGRQLVAGPGRHDAQRHARPEQQLRDVPQRPIATDADDGAHALGQGCLHGWPRVRLRAGDHDTRDDAVPPRDRPLDVSDNARPGLRVAHLRGVGVDDDEAARGFHPGHSVPVAQAAPQRASTER